MTALHAAPVADAAPFERAALFLDLDGTLTEIPSRPQDASIGEAAAALLWRLTDQLCGRLAVISGRPIDDVDRILQGSVRSVAGANGLQRRSADGCETVWNSHPKIAEAAQVMALFARAQAGLRVEPKEQSVALHYRHAPRAEAAVVEMARRLASLSELELQLGDNVAELKIPVPDKGAAVRAFLHEAPFHDAIPIYMGDSDTDEAAFAEVRRRGGVGILVGAARRTAATARLDRPDDVVAWLGAASQIRAFDLEALRWLA